MTTENYKPLPSPGDFVWCQFPQTVGQPGPKCRPALVVAVSPTTHEVEVVYGTSQKTEPPHVYPSEFVVDPMEEGGKVSGLSYRTKFDFSQRVKLPFNSDWFQIARGLNKNMPSPKMGVLHACYYKAAAAAANAAKAAEAVLTKASAVKPVKDN